MARAHIETLLADLPSTCSIVTVIDGHPAALGWLGSVAGHCAVSLGVEHFGQTGSIRDLYHHFGIGRADILKAINGLTAGRPIVLSTVS